MKDENSDINRKELRTAKGYRLRVSTHNLIKGLQELTGNDADSVITQSCFLMYKQILDKKEKNLNQ